MAEAPPPLGEVPAEQMPPPPPGAPAAPRSAIKRCANPVCAMAHTVSAKARWPPRRCAVHCAEAPCTCNAGNVDVAQGLAGARRTQRSCVPSRVAGCAQRSGDSHDTIRGAAPAEPLMMPSPLSQRCATRAACSTRAGGTAAGASPDPPADTRGGGGVGGEERRQCSEPRCAFQECPPAELRAGRVWR